MYKNKSTLLLALITLALTACGGGGGGGGGSPSGTTTEGKAVDGYLSGATALCDSNNNGIADSDEQIVLTDKQGKFVFSPGCASTVVITGGTNIDTGLPFKGVLKGPASSTVFTPLTGLLSAGLSMKQINTAAGLPGNTSLTHQDPALKDSSGALTNHNLLQRTLALHQVMQQSASMIAAMGKDNTAETTQSIYTEVVKATADTISANPGRAVIDPGGTVNQDLVNAIVKRSITRVQASGDAALTNIKANVAVYSAGSIAELAGPAIASQAEKLSTTTYTNSLAKSVQGSQTIANAAEQLADILKSVNDANVDLAEAGQALKGMISAEIDDPTGKIQAQTFFKQKVETQAVKAGVALSSVDWNAIYLHNNYFALNNDKVTIDDHEYPIHALLDGKVTTWAEVSSIKKVSFVLKTEGTPIPSHSTITTSIGFMIDDMEGPNSRNISAILDKVNLNMVGGNLTVTVPADAKLYIFGRNANGVEANFTLTNEEINRLNILTNQSFTLDAAKLMEVVKNKFENNVSQSSIISDIYESKGEFYFKFLMTKVDIRNCDDESYATELEVTVPYSGLAPVKGFGFEGIIIVK